MEQVTSRVREQLLNSFNLMTIEEVLSAAAINTAAVNTVVLSDTVR